MLRGKDTPENRAYNKWLRECAGKVRHTTETSAQYALDQGGDYTKHIYECTHCGGLHIGYKKT